MGVFDGHPVVGVVVAGEEVLDAVGLEEVDELIAVVGVGGHVFAIGVFGAGEGHFVGENEDVFGVAGLGLLEGVGEGGEVDAVYLVGHELVEGDDDDFGVVGGGEGVAKAGFAGEVGDFFGVEAGFEGVEPGGAVGVAVGFVVAADGVDGVAEVCFAVKIGPGAELLGEVVGDFIVFAADEVAGEEEELGLVLFDGVEQFLGDGGVYAGGVGLAGGWIGVGAVIAGDGKGPRVGEGGAGFGKGDE